MKECPNCGKKLNEEDTFCSNCGFDFNKQNFYDVSYVACYE